MAIDVEHPPAGAKLELYISPSCPYCRAAIDYYDGAGIAYTVHDAQNDRALQAAMFRYSGGIRLGQAASRLNGSLAVRSNGAGQA